MAADDLIPQVLLAGVTNSGTMSSSDGQRFPVRGKTVTGRNIVIHGGQVLSTYTHVSDQWSTFGTKIIVPTAREAHFVLDDFLGNATDLPIAEHATDTHGVVVTWTHLVPLTHWYQDSTGRAGNGSTGSGGVCASTAAAGRRRFTPGRVAR
ncbi:Tn3 family transposase [Nonomuraea sp. KM90]|uniref:Tn3 family transposase n=1 Tax=Nonomuraea sp. KM90 TaxID=3457428 RepID=UPI003FCD3C5E